MTNSVIESNASWEPASRLGGEDSRYLAANIPSTTKTLGYLDVSPHMATAISPSACPTSRAASPR